MNAGSVGAVVLAAGGSRRLGRPKQLVPVAGRTLVRRATDAAVEAGCRPVVVVLGAVFDEVRREVEPLAGAGVSTVRCEAWREGLGASLRCGVAALEAAVGGPESLLAAVLLLCDQPALEPSVVRRLVEAWDGTPGGRVACAYAATVGPPALFGRAFFSQLRALGGDSGAKRLLAGAPSVDWPAGARDVDGPEDL